ncbi:HIT domain-containing protein [Luteimonas sp. FXH3W]|uniref:HIT domain-containing protein n=1 Tax=Aquilutibacter rugosus TaxID=3115820 RepID=A0ABU7V1G4_9GAMM
MTPFRLDPQLAADTFVVGDLARCRVLLMNDSRYPWLILVPRANGLRDLTDLDADDLAQCMQEVRTAAAALQTCAPYQKLNVASLGNMVPQLHIHVIGRNESDAAWPKSVWGLGQAQPYSPAQLLLQELRAAIPGLTAA